MKEEVPGYICEASIYVYCKQHNIIHNIKKKIERKGSIVQDDRMRKKFESVCCSKVRTEKK